MSKDELINSKYTIELFVNMVEDMVSKKFMINNKVAARELAIHLINGYI